NRSGLVLQFINTMTFAARDFWARQGASDAHTLQSSVRSEQRRLVQKEPPPGGLRRLSVLASLLLGHSPTAGDAPSSRLARTEKRCNKRHRIYELEYLGVMSVSNRQIGPVTRAACDRSGGPARAPWPPERPGLSAQRIHPSYRDPDTRSRPP